MFNFNGSPFEPVQVRERSIVADTFTVRFDYIPSMKSDRLTLIASFYDDNGVSYVESLRIVERNEDVRLPLFLGAKDLKNYLITLWPNAASIQAVNKLS